MQCQLWSILQGQLWAGENLGLTVCLGLVFGAVLAEAVGVVEGREFVSSLHCTPFQLACRERIFTRSTNTRWPEALDHPVRDTEHSFATPADIRAGRRRRPGFAKCWLAAREALEVVSIDGKTLCGTIRPHAKTLHLLTVWAHTSGLVLAQKPMGDTNEPTAAIALCRRMLFKGKRVVADAMFCQREVCQTIRDREGHDLT